MKAYLFFAPLLFLIHFNAQAQQRTITSMKASYDPEGVAEIYDRIRIGLEFKYTDGQEVKTEGLLSGAYRWRSIKISSSNGNVENGYLLVNRQQLMEDHYAIDLTVTIPDASKPLKATIVLPRLESIRFNHYADSLKRGIRYYLNVEGIFSSGKIYPLDTNTIKFETSAGKLIGQDLLLNSNDATTRSITVTATNKRNHAMTITSTIPVKILLDE
ncbi:hypothetical protein [Chitinophaga rhizophila]|uniref:Uncharacterized protein n=1 Tax=Chitinophaga rhizophila TaxID=2866212 RepID=A0ABS7GA25_9BACT|nr:hypothetical protein [Chitinophaga rhizophila]MBW8684226.1 hypothetical protein [Chitinophaga rhizophila]